MQFTNFSWALTLLVGFTAASAVPVESLEIRDTEIAARGALPRAEMIFARAPAACVPICSGAVPIGQVACGTCGQQAPCTHYACSGGNRQVCGVKKEACYYSV